jgi:hypothetical protein
MNRRSLSLVLVVFMLTPVFPAETRAGFITSLSTNVTPIGGAYQYEYTLMNSTQSTISAYVFALAVAPEADLQLIVTPAGWDATYNAGDTSITWSAPSDELAVTPGSSTLFGFTSVEPPTTGDYQVTGFDPDNFQFYSNPGTTSVPGISSVPEPSALILLGISSLALIGYYRFWNENRCRPNVVTELPPSRPA